MKKGQRESPVQVRVARAAFRTLMTRTMVDGKRLPRITAILNKYSETHPVEYVRLVLRLLPALSGLDPRTKSARQPVEPSAGSFADVIAEIEAAEDQQAEQAKPDPEQSGADEPDPPSPSFTPPI